MESHSEETETVCARPECGNVPGNLQKLKACTTYSCNKVVCSDCYFPQAQGCLDCTRQCRWFDCKKRVPLREARDWECYECFRIMCPMHLTIEHHCCACRELHQVKALEKAEEHRRLNPFTCQCRCRTCMEPSVGPPYSYPYKNKCSHCSKEICGSCKSQKETEFCHIC